MANAAVNGIDLYYERAGSGPALLFVNGSGATLATAGPLLQVLAGHFDVLAHDQRGLGKTGVPPGPYAMADYAADAAALAHAVGWDRYRVLGVSFGGMVAQELAVTFPERIERLALLCTSPGGAGGASFPLHTLADLDPDEAAAKRLTLVDTRFAPDWLEQHPRDRALVAALAERSATEKTDEVRRGEALQLEARRHHDVFDRLGRIACPTFVGSGRYDAIAPPDNGRAIADQVPGAEFHLYEGGHPFFAQDPAALPDVIAFLAR